MIKCNLKQVGEIGITCIVNLLAIPRIGEKVFCDSGLYVVVDIHYIDSTSKYEGDIILLVNRVLSIL